MASITNLDGLGVGTSTCKHAPESTPHNFKHLSFRVAGSPEVAQQGTKEHAGAASITCQQKDRNP